MLPVTVPRLLAVMPRGRDRAVEFIGPLNQALAEWDITTTARVNAFLAQVAHECAELTTLRENLNYSAEGLVRTWPSRFTAVDALQYARQPERIANRVYANRMGNGDEASGDGWTYRGGGLIQLTGMSAFLEASIGTCGDADTLLKNPELIVAPKYACATAGWFWASRGLNELADRGEFKAITRAINGGMYGLVDRMAYLARAQAWMAA